MNKQRVALVSAFSIMLIFLMSINVSANSLNGADNELNKSGKQIETEIKIEEKELETYNLKEIPAGKGEFVKAYEEEFDEWKESVPGGKQYHKLMKKYDYQEGEFACGKFDILCHIINFGYVTGTSIVSALLSPLEKLAIAPEEIMNDSTLNVFNSAFKTFTISLLGVFISFQLIKLYSYRMTNHSDTSGVLNEKVIKLLVASVLLFAYDKFFYAILNIQYRVNFGIFNYLSNSQEVTQNIVLNMLLTPNGTVFVILILLFAILLAVLFFQMVYSFALVAIMYVVGPVAITTMVNDEYNMFSLWLKTLIARFLTLALQGLAVVLALSFGSRISFLDGDIGIFDSIFDKILALSFLIVGMSIPSLLKDFGNSSGSGRAITGGAKAVTTTVLRR